MQRQRHKDAEGKAVGLNIAGVNKKPLACENNHRQFQNRDRQFHCFSHLTDSFKNILVTNNIGTTGMYLFDTEFSQ